MCVVNYKWTLQAIPMYLQLLFSLVLLNFLNNMLIGTEYYHNIHESPTSDHLNLSINQMLFLWEISIKNQSILKFLIPNGTCSFPLTFFDWFMDKTRNENGNNPKIIIQLHHFHDFSCHVMQCVYIVDLTMKFIIHACLMSWRL